MIILFCDSSHAIYSLTRWLYVYIILGSAFLRISGQLAFGVQLDVLGFVRRRSKASRRLRMRLFIFRCIISCVYQQFVRTGCYNCPVLRVVLVMYLWLTLYFGVVICTIIWYILYFIVPLWDSVICSFYFYFIFLYPNGLIFFILERWHENTFRVFNVVI